MKTVTEQENTIARSLGLRNGLEGKCNGFTSAQAVFSEAEPLTLLHAKAMQRRVVPLPDSMADSLKIEG